MLLAYVGGIRSGKSAAAQQRFEAELQRQGLRSPAYLGTLLGAEAAHDAGLQQRLDLHRQARPAAWATVEVGRQLPAIASACREAGHDACLLDGLGAWAAHFLEAPTAALKEWSVFAELARPMPLLIVVLDEVGQGGVPGHPAARAFVDLNGALNQAVCQAADEAWSVQAGLSQRLK